ncbi:hypothetical protein Metfor_1209 [Methanoregula formicica SMSP]|uniref:Uncharacterized protein n=2 Tax=Methanoregula formicica TaxID=882104 RepID=L0HBZ8_METFS|nr:hypothetical protein Metfor_1209 [Methanoregula formicica SMSP]
MKRIKIGVILLALLLAAMAIIPMVSADNTGTSSATAIQAPTIDVKKIILPELQFEASQKFVDVNQGLNPDKNTVPSKFLTSEFKAGNQGVSKIPYGSIIYHSRDGITRVFDSSGKQLFAADDMKVAKVFTPQGPQAATYVHEVPEGSFINTQGDRKYTIYENSVILTEVTETSAVSGVIMAAPSDWPPQYIEGVEYTPTQAVGRFTSQWTVPTAPSSTQSGQITTIWNGLHRNSGASGVIQPVLAWNENGDLRYTIRVWEVSSSGTYKSTQYGARAGHTIVGDIAWDSSMSYWKVTIKDVNSGDISPMWSNLVSTSSCQAALMLEGFQQPVNRAYYPGAITFTNNVLRSTAGTVITPPASSVNGYVATTWYSGNNLLAVNKNNWPSSVVLSTGN